jgi:tetratricopeptide (TPR) repeat protein
MTRQLDDALHARVTAFFQEGEAFIDEGNYNAALERYQGALLLLPQPVEQWEASTLILAAIADAHFFSGNFESAKAALQDAMHCPDAIGNPYLHLRLGEAQLELGNIDRAKDELARAYIGGGPEVFEGDDPKYLRFIVEILRPAADEVGE